MAEEQRRLFWALALGLFVFLAQVLAGLFTGSLALLADCAHVLLDVLALSLAYFGARFAQRPPTSRYTYGFRRVEVLAAAGNGLALLLMGVVVKEAVARLGAPWEVAAAPMLGVGGAGLLANFLMAGLLWRHEGEDLNMRAAFLHVLGDTLGSVAVIAAGLVILLTGWTLVDPLTSLAIADLVGMGALHVLRQSLRILAEGVPDGLDPERVAQRIAAVPKVLGVRDLHLGSIGPGFPALSAHMVSGKPVHG